MGFPAYLLAGAVVLALGFVVMKLMAPEDHQRQRHYQYQHNYHYESYEYEDEDEEYEDKDEEFERRRRGQEENQSSNNKCPICFDEIEEDCQFLECAHILHKSCLINLITSGHKTCPICRRSIDLSAIL